MEINLDEISEKCKNDCKLFNVLFVLLSACNQNCLHCYIPDHDEIGLSLDIIKKTITEARELGALNVTLTGGEIFVRKDIFDIITFAKSLHMRVFLMSNASMLSNEDIERLSNLGIAEFSTTLFSMDKDKHDYITQMNGSFEKTLSNILLLKKYSIPVTIKTPLMEINKFDYKEVEKFASENNFNFMSTTIIFPKCNGDKFPCSLKINRDLNQVVKETHNLRKKYTSESLGYEKEGIPCSAGFSSITINYDGTVWPCNSLLLPVGDIKRNSLHDIWNFSNELINWREKSKKPLEPCKQCELKNKCLRCPGMALLENNDLYGCSSSAKEIAEILKGGKDNV